MRNALALIGVIVVVLVVLSLLTYSSPFSTRPSTSTAIKHNNSDIN